MHMAPSESAPHDGPVLAAAQVSSVVAACLLPDEAAWLVGGAVRDGLLGKASRDLDFAVRGDAARVARVVADLLNGSVFTSSETFSTHRVVLPNGVIDFAPLRGADIVDDLRGRDFTVDAMALPARAGDPGGRVGVGKPIDPLRGAADLRAGRLRACSSRALLLDPLRVLRLARLAVAYELEPTPGALDAAREAAPHLSEVSAERVAYELTALLGLPAAAAGVRVLDAVAALDVVLPELTPLKACEQSPYHHLEVFGHTLEALELLPQVVRQLGGERFLAEPSACGLRGAAPLAPLAWAVLLHDVGKPQVRRVDQEGRVMFWHHDQVGVDVADRLTRRLKLSRRFADYLSILIGNHLRLGFLVRESPLTRRALMRYRRAVEPFVFESVALSLADRVATRGDKTSSVSVARHYRLARQVWLEMPKCTQSLPLSGDDVMRLLGMAEGPLVGEALAALRDEVDAGEVLDQAGARSFLLRWRAGQSGGAQGA